MKKKLLVGLGNPGAKYAQTRHNVGHLLIDSLRSVDGYILKKNEGYMNTSGASVEGFLAQYDISYKDLVLMHDEWVFDVGEYRIQKNKGANRHKGVKSVFSTLGTQDFWRVRIGIGEPPENMSMRDYVLDTFNRGELKEIKDLAKQIKTDLQNID